MKAAAKLWCSQHDMYEKKAITDEEGDVLLTGFEIFFFNSSIDDMDPDGAKIKKKKKSRTNAHTEL